MAVIVTVPAMTVTVTAGTAGQVTAEWADTAAASMRPKSQRWLCSIMIWCIKDEGCDYDILNERHTSITERDDCGKEWLRARLR